jgi:hypothetical protein
MNTSRKWGSQVECGSGDEKWTKLAPLTRRVSIVAELAVAGVEDDSDQPGGGDQSIR